MYYILYMLLSDVGGNWEIVCSKFERFVFKQEMAAEEAIKPSRSDVIRPI